MQLLEALSADPTAFLARANPLAKIGAGLVVMLAAFLTTDPLTPTLLLGAELAILPATGIRAAAFARRLWPLLVAAVGVGIFNALLAGDPRGEPIFSVGPLVATTASVATGIALAIRLLAIVGAGVLAFVATEPTDLADALLQQLRLSPRLAVAALAALRALPILADEWQTIGLARRARGVDPGRSPSAALSLFAGRLLTLLVRAIRRATQMAAAMDARGLGARECRGVARPQRMAGGDWLLLGGATLAAVAASVASVAAGSWRFLLG